MSDPTPCGDLDAAIEHYKAEGYRLDMIFPADSPREALVSSNGETLRLRLSPRSQDPGSTSTDLSDSGRGTLGIAPSGSDWKVGRAGMEYRDLIPGRLGGRVIASIFD